MANPSLTTLTDEALIEKAEQHADDALTWNGHRMRAGALEEFAAVNRELARRLRARGTWQPIATAPKDGTAVLVWCGDAIVERALWDGGAWVSPRGGNPWPIGRATHWKPIDTPKDTPDAE